jgi:3-hydroxypropanoate dehydrogenase
MTPSQAVDATCLARLFTEARTHFEFSSDPVPAALLQRVYELASLGPTSMNCQPARFVFVSSTQARERLLPHVLPGNQPKVKSAPVTVIVARDTRFYEFMPQVWHVPGARENFEAKPELARGTAVRNATMTGAYLLMAARAMGLACGPMSGIDTAGIDREFFPDGRWETDFLMNLGWPAGAYPFPRGHRLPFADACVLA